MELSEEMVVLEQEMGKLAKEQMLRDDIESELREENARLQDQIDQRDQFVNELIETNQRQTGGKPRTADQGSDVEKQLAKVKDDVADKEAIIELMKEGLEEAYSKIAEQKRALERFGQF